MFNIIKNNNQINSNNTYKKFKINFYDRNLKLKNLKKIF